MIVEHLQLLDAAKQGDAAGIALVLEAAASGDPASRAHALGEALEVACRSGHASCADLLLRAGADPDHVVQRGEQRHWRPIHSAAAAGSTECTKLLLLAGADACTADSSGAVALSSACGVETVRLLLEEAPQAAVVLDRDGNFPALAAIQAGRCAEALWLVALAPVQPPPVLVHHIAQAVAALTQEGQMEQQAEMSLAATLLAARVDVEPIQRLWWAARGGLPLTTSSRLAIWLPAILQNSEAAAARLVRLLPPSDRQRLRILALSLMRNAHQLSLPLPTPIMHRLLAESAALHALEQPREYELWCTPFERFRLESAAWARRCQLVAPFILFTAAFAIIEYYSLSFVWQVWKTIWEAVKIICMVIVMLFTQFTVPVLILLLAWMCTCLWCRVHL